LDILCVSTCFFLDKVTSFNDDRVSVDIIFLDFAKAFDKDPHRRLMFKLKAHGIDGRVADWISNWLDNTLQRVYKWNIIRLEAGHKWSSTRIRAGFIAVSHLHK